MYGRAVGNICTIWHDYIIANGTVTADSDKVTHCSTCPDNAIGINQCVISNGCITVDFRADIQQHTIANSGTVLDTGVL